MGIRKFLPELVYENDVIRSRQLLPSSLTILDANAFFYSNNTQDPSECTKEYCCSPELAAIREQMNLECRHFSTFVDEFYNVMRQVEHIVECIPIAKIGLTTCIVTCDGRPPCLKWKTQRHRRSGGDIEHGLTPWSLKSVHFSRFIQRWLEREIDRTEDNFANRYDNVLIGDNLVPGEGDYKIIEYIHEFFNYTDFNGNHPTTSSATTTTTDAAAITVVTDDSDMIMLLLHTWMIHLRRSIEIQIVLRRRKSNPSEWFILRISDFAAFMSVRQPANNDVVRISNLIFLFGLFGNDYVPQIARFPLSRERVKVMIRIMMRNDQKIFFSSHTLQNSLDWLRRTTTTNNKQQSNHSQICKDDDTFNASVAYLRAMYWNAANSQHKSVPWSSGEVVNLAAKIDATHVSKVTFDHLIDTIKLLTNKDLITCASFGIEKKGLQFNNILTGHPLSREIVAYGRELWYLEYILGDCTLEKYSSFIRNTRIDSDRHGRLLSLITDCTHFGIDRNSISRASPVEIAGIVQTIIQKFLKKMNFEGIEDYEEEEDVDDDDEEDVDKDGQDAKKDDLSVVTLSDSDDSVVEMVAECASSSSLRME